MPRIKKTEDVTATSEEVLNRDFNTDISKLDIVFGNEDMNKVVEKINELIDKSNG